MKTSRFARMLAAQHLALSRRRTAALELARREAEVRYAKEIVAQTGCDRDEAYRVAMRRVAKDQQ